MLVQRIAVRQVHFAPGRRVCEIRAGNGDYSFPFSDLVEFSDGVRDVLVHAARLVPVNAVRPTDRAFMQLEGLRVQDSVEHNRNMIAAREAAERRAAGEHIAAGAWYMEISINGTDTDCSFDTVEQLFQIVQTVIRREFGKSGALIVPGTAEFHRAS